MNSMNSTNPTEPLRSLPIIELALVIGLPLASIMAGVSLVVVSYLHGFAILATP